MRNPTQERGIVRRGQILAAAVKLSEQKGYTTITRKQIADLANCAEGSINEYFGSMEGMRDAVIMYARDENNLKILAQAIVMKHPKVRRLDSERRKAALLSL